MASVDLGISSRPFTITESFQSLEFRSSVCKTFDCMHFVSFVLIS